MASFSFTGKNGIPASKRVEALMKASSPTVGDALMAGQVLRALIIQRTQKQGVDVAGSTFAPYSTKGPYYDYPQRGGSAPARGQAASRLARITGGKRTRLGVKYASYAAFKQALGRGHVDLTGPRAPHMMQALVVKAGGSQVSGTQERNLSVTQQPQRASQLELGFYGEEAARAKGHNEGAGHLPKRRFFASSQKDLELATKIMAARVAERRNA